MSRAMGFPRCVMTISSPASIQRNKLVYRFRKSRTVAVFNVLHIWRTNPACQSERWVGDPLPKVICLGTKEHKNSAADSKSF